MSVVLGMTAFLAAWAMGAAAMAAVAPQWMRAAAPASWVFVAASGVPLASGLYWVWIVTLRSSGIPYLALEWCVLAGCGVAAALRRPGDAPPAPRRAARYTDLLAWVVAAALLTTLTVMMARCMTPYGVWDAWDMWNTKAKFLYHARDNWTLVFAPISGHSDYPLLLPLTVARTWCYLGDDSPVGAQATAVALGVTGPVLMMCGLAVLRTPVIALAGLALYLCIAPALSDQATQDADGPLAVWLVGASLAAMLALERAVQRRGWLVVTGVLCSAAAWTKNEGAAFALLLTGLMIVVLLLDEGRRAGRSLLVLLGAAAPLLLCTAWLKLGYAGPSYMTAHRSISQLAQLTGDPDRHARIWREVLLIVSQSMGGWLPWAVAAAWLMLRGARWRAAAAIWTVLLVAQLAAYYAAYLLTPLDIGWQLATSAKRLASHVAPMLALLPMLLARDDHPRGAACEPRL